MGQISNAKVTAITILLEHIGNATVIIHGVHFTTRSSWKLSILIHEMFCYCIFTPYAFLMNTSDNKNRIIKYGWSNVLKNIIGKPIVETENENKVEDSHLFRPKKACDEKNNDTVDTQDVKLAASISNADSPSIISKSTSDFKICSLEKSRSSYFQQKEDEQERTNPKNVGSIKNLSRNSSQTPQLLNVNKLENNFRHHGIHEAHHLTGEMFNPVSPVWGNVSAFEGNASSISTSSPSCIAVLLHVADDDDNAMWRLQ